MKKEPLIGLRLSTTHAVTVKGYERLRREVIAAHLAGDITLTVQLAALILSEGQYRYNECVLLQAQAQAEKRRTLERSRQRAWRVLEGRGGAVGHVVGEKHTPAWHAAQRRLKALRQAIARRASVEYRTYRPGSDQPLPTVLS